jgi:hypothetical protein
MVYAVVPAPQQLPGFRPGRAAGHGFKHVRLHVAVRLQAAFGMQQKRLVGQYQGYDVVRFGGFRLQGPGPLRIAAGGRVIEAFAGFIGVAGADAYAE